MSDDQVTAGAKYKKSMSDLKEELGSVCTKIGNQLMPYFGKAADWLNENSPKITEFIDKVVKVLGDTIAFVADNGSKLSIVLGLVFSGIIALNAIKTIQEVMMAWNTVVKVATAVQKSWNLAMEMNPIALVIIGIGLLIAAGVLLYKNWDVVSAKLKSIWEGISSVASNIFGGLVNIIKQPINWAIKGLNSFIDGLDKIKIPDWVPLVGGKEIDIPHIPMLANGGDITRAGRVLVGEKGPEFLDLPEGARVTPLNKSGNEQHFHIDKFIVQSKGDERATLAQLQFLAAL